MSRDIFVQDMPPDVMSVDEIPDDWEPSALPFGATKVREVVLSLVPDAHFKDRCRGEVTLPGAVIEVIIDDSEQLESFALHVRATDPAGADRFVKDLLERLSARAFDPEGAPESGIFGCG